MTASDLKALIASAWADVEYPGDRAIAYDNTGYHLECKQVGDFFRQKRWKDISHSVLRTYRGDESACLSFMSPAGFRYYLPAYMFVAIDNYGDADVTASAAVNALIPRTSKGLAEFWTERTSGFSGPQTDAIVAFLWFMEENHGDDYLSQGPKQALQYWKGARMQIRPYRDTDWATVREIYDLSKPDEMRGVVDASAIPPLEADHDMKALFHDSQILVMEDADRVVGFGGNRRTFITWLFVHPNYRRKGVAQALVREILARLSGTITLNVAMTNVAAHNLYKRMGFTVEREFMGQFNGHACPVATLRYEKAA